MIHYYALTITPVGKRPYTKTAFTRSLDKYEKNMGIRITHRNFEIAPKTKKLHLHALVASDIEVLDFRHQKNHNVRFDVCTDKAGWIKYITKEVNLKRLV